MQKLSIDFRSFFKRGLSGDVPSEGVIILICGKQGSGKSFAAVKMITERMGATPIFSNSDLTIPGRSVTVGTWRQILAQDTSDSIVFIDEIFTSFTKSDRIPHEYTSWLAQSRKANRIVILIAQEFLEVPLVLRRFAKYLVSCTHLGPLILEHWADGDSLHYDSETGEYVADPYRLRIYKRTKAIGELYDTREQIQG